MSNPRREAHYHLNDATTFLRKSERERGSPEEIAALRNAVIELMQAVKLLVEEPSR